MQRKYLPWAVAVLAALLFSYWQYFGSGWHIPDYEPLRDNPAIRSLASIPRFFVDPATSSTTRSGSAYRPLVTTSFALDYLMGRGSPIAFHLDAFAAYLCGLALTGWLAFVVFESISPRPWNAFVAIVAAALFGLHPVSAEMLNAVSHRDELYAGLGVIGGIALYAGLPNRRDQYLYLIPPLLGILANPSALIFGPILLGYILLIEPAPPEEGQALTPDQTKSRDETNVAGVSEPAAGSTRIRIRRRKRPLLRYLKAQFPRFRPALIFTIVASGLQWLLMPFELHARSGTLGHYWFTQPWVAWTYFASFFAPFHLSPVNDLALFDSYDVRGLWGALFLAGLATLILVLLLRKRKWRPLAFGIFWFLAALLPGSLIWHADAAGDRRMFLPFVGLAMAVPWAIHRLLPRSESWRRMQAYGAIVALAALSIGTFMRNHVWQNEETLWRDAIEKNPGSSRALINYAMVLEGENRPAEALTYLERAHAIKADPGEVEANMGTASAALGRDFEAEEHFRRAQRLAPEQASSYLPYAVWLEKKGRHNDAIQAYMLATALAPSDLRPRYGLMRIYQATADWNSLRSAVESAQKIAPGDGEVAAFAAISSRYPDAVRGSERIAAEHPSAENYLTLSEAYCLAGRYNDCLRMAQKALSLRPDYADAYNSLGAAYVSLGRYDEGIAAVKKALKLNPDLDTARTNLAAWENLKP